LRSAHMGDHRRLKGSEYHGFGDRPGVRNLYCFDTRSSCMSIILVPTLGAIRAYSNCDIQMMSAIVASEDLK
jgi:hypothetical protein